jgi:hypothetical protein
MTIDNAEKEKKKQGKCYSSENMEVLQQQAISTDDLRDVGNNNSDTTTTPASTQVSEQGTRRKRHSA